MINFLFFYQFFFSVSLMRFFTKSTHYHSIAQWLKFRIQETINRRLWCTATPCATHHIKCDAFTLCVLLNRLLLPNWISDFYFHVWMYVCCGRGVYSVSVYGGEIPARLMSERSGRSLPGLCILISFAQVTRHITLYPAYRLFQWSQRQAVSASSCFCRFTWQFHLNSLHLRGN